MVIFGVVPLGQGTSMPRSPSKKKELSVRALWYQVGLSPVHGECTPHDTAGIVLEAGDEL
jgi:hypothetical protein